MKALTRHKIALSNLGLVAVLLIGGIYLLVYVIRLNPLEDTYSVRVDMSRSGGLQIDNDVTLRGYRVGKVTAIRLTAKGVAAITEIDSAARIPIGSKVAVRALSAAGEQYLDFLPDRSTGPYLANNDSVSEDRVTTPQTITTVLASADRLFGQIDPVKIGVIVDQLDKALAGGPDQLRSIVNGLSVGTAGLDKLLPQTVNLLTSLRTIAGTTAHAQPDLGTLTRNSRVLFDQAAAADAELREMLDRSPGYLSTMRDVLASDTGPLTRVAQDFVVISRAAQLRTPAMSVLFPSLQLGAKALGVPAHDGNFNTIVDIFDRPFCEYRGPSYNPTTIPNQGRVRLWNYCPNTNPALQIRGSANAPRPNVANNGAQKPPGADPNQMSTQLPNPSTW